MATVQTISRSSSRLRGFRVLIFFIQLFFFFLKLCVWLMFERDQNGVKLHKQLLFMISRCLWNFNQPLT